jgi:glycerol-3-phosphate acyltransferase PlsY
MFWYFLAGGYILGSIPFGLIIGKIKGIDIRQYGSGNIGATNVNRVLGKIPAVISFLFDMAKGFVPLIIARILGFSVWQTAFIGVAIVLGHCWSVFLLFKGGKGISTTFGVIVALDWRIGLLLGLLWLIQLFIWKYVSLASIISAGLIPLAFLFVYTFDPLLVLAVLLLALIDIFKHLDNIKRLREGTENKIGQKAIVDANQN